VGTGSPKEAAQRPTPPPPCGGGRGWRGLARGFILNLMLFKAKQMKDVLDALGTLQAEMRTLKIEWLETYDKIHRLYHRLNQRDRYKRDKEAAEASNGDEGVPDPYAGLDPISRRILARRRGKNAVPHTGGQSPSS